MSVDPASWLGRCVAIALLLLVGLVAVQALVLPVASAFWERTETIAEMETTLAGYVARSGAETELKARREELLRRQSGETGLLTESSAPLAGAALQGTSRRMFEANSGALRSIQVLAPRPEGALQRVAVRIDGTLPAGRLLDFLHAAETAVPYVFIEALELRVPDGTTTERTGHAQITMRAEIAAYRRPEAP